jgi:hypothetical protein
MFLEIHHVHEKVYELNKCLTCQFLLSENINFLIADGIKFAHPLHHLGKSKDDLPLIAIDSFRHMYLFPNYEDMEKPGKLKEVIRIEKIMI